MEKSLTATSRAQAADGGLGGSGVWGARVLLPPKPFEPVGSPQEASRGKQPGSHHGGIPAFLPS